MSPISWFSKKQNTVETSTFGSEYVALRITIEKVISLRYKLRMMGVSIDGSANIFMDNESVIKSGINPDTVLKKETCVDSLPQGPRIVCGEYYNFVLGTIARKFGGLVYQSVGCSNEEVIVQIGIILLNMTVYILQSKWMTPPDTSL